MRFLKNSKKSKTLWPTLLVSTMLIASCGPSITLKEDQQEATSNNNNSKGNFVQIPVEFEVTEGLGLNSFNLVTETVDAHDIDVSCTSGESYNDQTGSSILMAEGALNCYGHPDHIRMGASGEFRVYYPLTQDTMYGGDAPAVSSVTGASDFDSAPEDGEVAYYRHNDSNSLLKVEIISQPTAGGLISSDTIKYSVSGIEIEAATKELGTEGFGVNVSIAGIDAPRVGLLAGVTGIYLSEAGQPINTTPSNGDTAIINLGFECNSGITLTGPGPWNCDGFDMVTGGGASVVLFREDTSIATWDGTAGDSADLFTILGNADVPGEKWTYDVIDADQITPPNTVASGSCVTSGITANWAQKGFCAAFDNVTDFSHDDTKDYWACAVMTGTGAESETVYGATCTLIDFGEL